MNQDIERHIFGLLQRRQKGLRKILAAGLAASLLFVALSVYYRWPGVLALLPWALIGPFAWNVITARCPRCSKLIHRTPAGAFAPLLRCARCGFRG
jgi:hypothetical protein